jgi:hypothetical protein
MSDSIRPKRTRPRPNRAYGIKAESEQAHINAEEEKTDAEQAHGAKATGSHQCQEMLDATEVHYICFGEFLFPSALVRPIE